MQECMYSISNCVCSGPYLEGAGDGQGFRYSADSFLPYYNNILYIYSIAYPASSLSLFLRPFYSTTVLVLAKIMSFALAVSGLWLCPCNSS